VGGRRRRPSNAPGAHYLADPKLAPRLVAAAQVRRGDLVLDLGAGAGALSAPLLSAGARVVAVERDSALAGRLRRRFSGASVTVLEQDLLEVPLPRRAYRVVASIPFSITTPLVGRLLDPAATCLERAALVVEWGAGRRVCAAHPADPRILWWSARYDLRVAGRIGPQSFSPPPRVDAAVLVAARRPSPLVPRQQQASFARLLAAAFETRRAPVAVALGPVFSRRQARRLVRDLSVDPRLPISMLRIDQWAVINTAMVTLVPARRWPQRTPGWWTFQSHPARAEP
jgi:23S rRNA (adenine-N6)-dimethyltransferase